MIFRQRPCRALSCWLIGSGLHWLTAITGITYHATPVSARMLMDFQQHIPTTPLLDCDGRSLADILPEKTEPSDLVWDPIKQQLYLVSDNGHLVIVGLTTQQPTSSGDSPQSPPYFKLIDKIKVKHKPDLEGVAFIPSSPDYVYLGVESPAEVLKFHIPSQTITSKVSLVEYINSTPLNSQDHPQEVQPNQGIESLVYIPAKDPLHHPGYIVAGRQQDARLFVFEILSHSNAPSTSSSSDSSGFQMKFLGTAYAPGPLVDLSAMTFWKDRIWLLYDKPKQMHALHLTKFYESLSSFDPQTVVSYTASDETNDLEPSKDVGVFSFDVRGQEGIVFAENVDLGSSNGKSTVVFVAIDAPHKTGRKDLLMFPLETFFACFSSRGISGLPT
ncbi:hypothetical protein BASA60_004465 [Batrachochytrium salamandrivorans]|nr:hypothetical protein BASA60_004465 [Batrachochytrium salamandrivorans]KAH9272625.1 hypothetical protein BASA83_005130 [Batrachochytrium salamandrivorans]